MIILTENEALGLHKLVKDLHDELHRSKETIRLYEGRVYNMEGELRELKESKECSGLRIANGAIRWV